MPKNQIKAAIAALTPDEKEVKNTTQRVKEQTAVKAYYIIETITEKDARLASQPYETYSAAANALADRMEKNPSYSGSITSRII